MYHKKEGENCNTNLFFYFLIIYIVVPLYRRKFYDGHIILVWGSTIREIAEELGSTQPNLWFPYDFFLFNSCLLL